MLFKQKGKKKLSTKKKKKREKITLLALKNTEQY